MNNPTSHILLVDENTSLTRLLSLRLEAQGFAVTSAHSSAQALKVLAVQDDIQLVISDLCMKGMDGLELFEQIQTRNFGLPVIIITAQGSIPEAVSATQRGVFGFLTKPIDKNELITQINAALLLSGRIIKGKRKDQWRAHILSRSEVMEQLLTKAKQVADSGVSVLISGSSGSGKELLAQGIHRASSRRDQPFVAVNCGALPEPLLESELFGHVKGAFSGATRDHLGLFRAAEGGTLLLDEIGDMSVALQVKLLRVLQERQVRPVGSTQNYNVDVRIISATHTNLEQAMLSGQFREDLFYRLNVVNLVVPDLNERPEDIPLMANRFLAETAKGQRREVTSFAPEALRLLVSAKWPGNVRQLENVVQQTAALAHTKVIPVSLVSAALAKQAGFLSSYSEARHHFERDYLVKVLKLSDGNVSQAARLAQRNRTDFYKLMQRHGLNANQFKN